MTWFTKSKGAPQWGKSTERDQNRISSEGGQDSSACKISGYSLHAFSGKCPETLIWPVSLSQSDTKSRKINWPWPKFHPFWRWSGYVSMQNFTLFPPCVLRKCQETPNLTRFTKSKWRQKKENQQTATIIYSVLVVGGGQDTSACKISGHSLHAFSGKCPETSPNGRTDRPKNGHGWSDGPTDPYTGGKKVFRADGRTDNPKT